MVEFLPYVIVKDQVMVLKDQVVVLKLRNEKLPGMYVQ